jgi:hypothetical protein
MHLYVFFVIFLHPNIPILVHYFLISTSIDVTFSQKKDGRCIYFQFYFYLDL